MNNSKSIEYKIRQLAREHNIKSTPTNLDKYAQAITRLSGDNVQLDEIEYLIIHLGQKGCISMDDAINYSYIWIKEKEGNK